METGKSNLQELQANTHPRGTFIRYFAEGANSQFFETRIALANPTDGHRCQRSPSLSDGYWRDLVAGRADPA